MTQAAVDIICKLPSTKITTIGIDVPGFLHQTEAVIHLQHLGRSDISLLKIV
jgi:hypothetical protein